MQILAEAYPWDGFHVLLPIPSMQREDGCTCRAGEPRCLSCVAWDAQDLPAPSCVPETRPRVAPDDYTPESPLQTITEAIATAKAARDYARTAYGSQSQAYRRADAEVSRWAHRLQARQARAGEARQRRRASRCWTVADLEARLANDLATRAALGDAGRPIDRESALLRKKTRKQLSARIQSAQRLLEAIRKQEGSDGAE